MAPLKRRAPDRARFGRRGFHAYKSVAPLKHVGVDQERPAVGQFPRLQKRGPIEASKRRRVALTHHLFPRLQKRGPIEASQPGSYRTAGPGFPRLQKRGPIEATPPQISGRRPPRVSTLTKAWPH